MNPQRRLMLGAIAALTLLAGVMHYAGAPALPAFGIAAAALAGLAWWPRSRPSRWASASAPRSPASFANALLVLGLVIVAGARQSEDSIMRFSPRLPNDTATLLLLAGFIIVLVGLSAASHDKASDDVVAISAIASVLLRATYSVWVAGYLRTGSAAAPTESHGEGGMPLRSAIVMLAFAGSARPSCRIGSSPRCGPRSISSASRRSSRVS
jgi:hypothetical protein